MFTVCHFTFWCKVAKRKISEQSYVRNNSSGKWMDAAPSSRTLAVSRNRTNLAQLFLINRKSHVSASVLPVSGLAGSGFSRCTPFYSYRWSFSKAGRGLKRCLLHGCGSDPLQANEQRQAREAGRRLRCLSVRTVPLDWGLDRERRGNLPGAELTAPVTVWPISVQGAEPANK